MYGFIKNRVWLPLIFIVPLLFFIYRGSLDASYLSWDDDYNIWLNSDIILGPWYNVWRHHYYGMFIPITNTVWSILFHLGHGSTFPFRILNILVHVANTALVGGFFMWIHSLSQNTPPIDKSTHGRTVALLIGMAFFAFHPLQVASVAWISGLRDLLAAFFALLSIITYFKSQRLTNTIVATFFFTIGLLAKPNIAVVPAIIILLCFLFTPKELKKTFHHMLIWVLISVADAIGTMTIQSESLEVGAPLWFRPLVVLDSFGFHLNKIIFPFNLAVDYGRSPLKLYANPELLIPNLLVCLFFFLATFWMTKKHHPLKITWAWFILMLPVSGIIPFAFQNISTVTDHYNYLPLFIFSTTLFITFDKLITQKTALFGAYLFASALLATFLSVSLSRVEIWHDDKVFFTDMLKNNPRSYAASMSLGSRACERNEVELGLKLMTVAIELKPLDPVTIANKIFCLYRIEKFAEIIEYEKLFNEPAFVKNAKKHDFATASMLASIGASHARTGNMKRGLIYFCLAHNMVISDKNYSNSLQFLLQNLEAQGVHASCEDELQKYSGKHPVEIVQTILSGSL